MKLIKLSEEHYIIVNDSEIKQGDWVVGCTRTVVQCMYPENVHHEDIKKITHSTQPLESVPLYKMPNGELIDEIWYDKIQQLSLSEIKELIGEVDVHTKAMSKYSLGEINNEHDFTLGYKQALEDNKEKKYTEEDLMKFYKYVKTHTVTEALRHIQPQTEWEVEIVDGKLKLIQ